MNKSDKLLKTFDEPWDCDINHIVFTNGIFDLINMKFTEMDTSNSRLSTKYDYKIFSYNDPLVLNIRSFMSKIFPDPLLKRYFIEYMAMIIKGRVSCDILFMFGKGENGKSTTLKLIEQTLGDYAVRFKTTVSKTGTQYCNRITELERNIRFAIMEQPENDELINMNMLEYINGNNIFYNKTLKLAMACNQLPIFKCDDLKTLRSIRVLPFETVFIHPLDNVPYLNKLQIENKIYKHELNLSKKISDMKQVFMWVIIEVIKDIKLKGLSEDPLKIKKETYKYIKNKNIFYV